MIVPPTPLVTALLWVLVAAGPVMGAAALLRPAPPVPTIEPQVPPAVTGTAELAVTAHLSRPADRRPDPLAPVHRDLRGGDPLADLPPGVRVAAAAAPAPPLASAALSATPAGPGRWGVIVAVLRPDGLEGWQVTVAVAPDGGAVVESLPVPVALPAAGIPPPPDLPRLDAPDPDDPLAVAVDGFLQALLTASGDLDRYTVQGSGIAPPQPVDEVELRRIAARLLPDRRAVALAEVRLHHDDGAVRLGHYPLLLRPAGGRWEVQQLLPALPLAG